MVCIEGTSKETTSGVYDAKTKSWVQRATKISEADCQTIVEIARSLALAWGIGRPRTAGLPRIRTIVLRTCKIHWYRWLSPDRQAGTTVAYM
jgi:hypothetical protein